MNASQHKLHDLVIVDACRHDYQLLLVDKAMRHVLCHFFSSGRQGLRAQGLPQGSHCLINLQLPDMPGIELLTSIRQRSPGSRLYLVSNTYSHLDERTARSVGPAAYFCKPIQATWLESCIFGGNRAAAISSPRPLFRPHGICCPCGQRDHSGLPP